MLTDREWCRLFFFFFGVINSPSSPKKINLICNSHVYESVKCYHLTGHVQVSETLPLPEYDRSIAHRLPQAENVSFACHCDVFAPFLWLHLRNRVNSENDQNLIKNITSKKNKTYRAWSGSLFLLLLAFLLFLGQTLTVMMSASFLNKKFIILGAYWSLNL